MRRISINEIIESLSCGEETFCRIKGVAPKYNFYNRPRFVAGRGSVIFDVVVGGSRHALKCYTVPQELRGQLYDHISSLGEDFIIRPRFFPSELCTTGGWADVALYPWVEGRSLEWEIRAAIQNQSQERIDNLISAFLTLVRKLLSAEWRHGDLKAENIILLSDRSGMMLVDCDALYAPGLQPRGEVGTPPYVHPARGTAFDSHIDDFSIALILISLVALHYHPELFRGETMVALPSEGNREIIAETVAHSEPLTRLHEALYSSDYKIDNIKYQIDNVHSTNNTPQ